MQTGTRYLDPQRLSVFVNESGNLCARLDGEGEWSKVTVRRAFPYSDPDHYIALYADEEEIGIVRDLAGVDADSRAVLAEELRKRYHVPVIQRILAIEEEQNVTRWRVETDSGPRTFEVHSRRSFRRLPGGGLVIVDVDTNRFRIPDRNALDARSRRLLDLQC